MSLISNLIELRRACDYMEDKARTQQFIYFNLIQGIVKMHQANRIAKNYAVSDPLRDLLASVGVKIIQGSGGYDYDKIPDALKGRPIGDTWTWELLAAAEAKAQALKREVGRPDRLLHETNAT